MRANRFFGFLFFLVFISAVGMNLYLFRSEVSKILSYSECDTPITYKLGNLDPKFSLTEQKVTNDLKDAAEIWGSAYGKPLFVNSPSAALTVNFVYDERSQLNANINKLGGQLDEKGVTLKQQSAQFDTDVAAFEKKLADYNAEVARINQSGGAKSDVYNRLVAEGTQLRAESASLNARAKQLNLAATNFNSNVANFNQDITQFNEVLAQKPEEGLYNSGDQTITIYFADNPQELIHTLVHEFGHARGMQHTTDPKSLMFKYDTSYLSVTTEDKNQLTEVCKEKLIFTHWIDVFVVRLRATFSKINTP
jgi:hypothetical protein